MSDKQWYAVRTKPRREVYARDQFVRQEFEVYLPLCLQRIRHARKRIIEARPVFPGYLFLQLQSIKNDWTKIRSTYGAIDVVHFGGHYPTVPDELIAELKRREDGRGFILMNEIKMARLAPYQKVRFTHGCFKEQEGLFIEMRGEDRVLLLLDLLQRQVYTEAPLEEIDPA